MYYKVIAKCGHVRPSKFVLKAIYIKAESKKEAARIGRYTPRVKHDKKNAIQEVSQISFDEYQLGLKAMNDDLYFQVTNSTDQRRFNAVPYESIIPEEQESFFKEKSDKKRKVEAFRRKEDKQMLRKGEYLTYE